MSQPQARLLTAFQLVTGNIGPASVEMYSEMRVTTDQKNVRKICRITISFKSLNKCANRPNASLRKTSEGAARSGAAQLNELIAAPYRKGIQETPVVAGIRVRIERLTRYDLTHAYLHQQGIAGLGTDAISTACEASLCEPSKGAHVGRACPVCMSSFDTVSAWSCGR